MGLKSALIESVKKGQARIHQELGCSGCYYTDKKALRERRACCTHIQRIEIDTTSGRCLTRKEDK